jgi:hypothetical protein
MRLSPSYNAGYKQTNSAKQRNRSNATARPPSRHQALLQFQSELKNWCVKSPALLSLQDQQQTAGTAIACCEPPRASAWWRSVLIDSGLFYLGLALLCTKTCVGNGCMCYNEVSKMQRISQLHFGTQGIAIYHTVTHVHTVAVWGSFTLVSTESGVRPSYVPSPLEPYVPPCTPDIKPGKQAGWGGLY